MQNTLALGGLPTRADFPVATLSEHRPRDAVERAIENYVNRELGMRAAAIRDLVHAAYGSAGRGALIVQATFSQGKAVFGDATYCGQFNEAGVADALLTSVEIRTYVDRYEWQRQFAVVFEMTVAGERAPRHVPYLVTCLIETPELGPPPPIEPVERFLPPGPAFVRMAPDATPPVIGSVAARVRTCANTLLSNYGTVMMQTARQQFARQGRGVFFVETTERALMENPPTRFAYLTRLPQTLESGECIDALAFPEVRAKIVSYVPQTQYVLLFQVHERSGNTTQISVLVNFESMQ